MADDSDDSDGLTCEVLYSVQGRDWGRGITAGPGPIISGNQPLGFVRFTVGIGPTLSEKAHVRVIVKTRSSPE